MIEVRGLQKSFGDVQALKEVTFNAPDGRITGLLGPNGAGKTTTLRILATVLRPDAGTATIDGKDCATETLDVQRRIGVLPDQRGLYPRLTSRENIRYYGRLHGMSPEAIDARIETLSDILDMGEFLDRRAEGFSSGQRLKVAIARALIHDPRHVILDEPTSGLDVMSTRALRDVVRSLKTEGRCVLFSSHVMQEVAALCDDIVIVGAGKVVARGTPDEIRAATGCDDLEDAFVAVLGSAEGLE